MTLQEANKEFSKLPRVGKIVAVVFVALVGLGIVALIIPGEDIASTRPAPPALEDISKNKTAIEAYASAQILLENQLKAPATAKWPPLQEVKSFYNESSNQWTVVAYVDSSNDFGALIRTNFIAVLDYLGGDRWNLAYLTITD